MGGNLLVLTSNAERLFLNTTLVGRTGDRLVFMGLNKNLYYWMDRKHKHSHLNKTNIIRLYA